MAFHFLSLLTESFSAAVIHIKPFDEQYQEHEQPHQAPADEDNPESSRQGQHLISRGMLDLFVVSLLMKLVMQKNWHTLSDGF